MKFSVFLFISSLFLIGCTESRNPAPVVTYAPGQGAGAAGVHTVAAGETLWLVSKRYNLPARDIAVANDLPAPFYLTPGQRLKLPPPQQYKARDGDSVSTVSQLFGVGASEIARMNHLNPPYRLKDGQVLRLPSITEQRAPQVFTPAPVQVAQLAPPRAQRFLKAPSPAPRLTGVLKVPQPSRNLSLPHNSFPPHPDPLPKGEREAAQSAAGEGVGKSSVIQTSLFLTPKKAAIPKTPRRGGSKFLWPVRGNIISSYGPKSGGLYNDGVNIKAPRGADVKAAENGVVVYAGNDLKGSGNLVLIRHADRWMTAYAHMEKIRVKRGDVIKRGQPIGAVGATGSVDSPQLHFEIRRGADALNPRPYLEG